MQTPLARSRVVSVSWYGMAFVGFTLSLVGCDAIKGQPAKAEAQPENVQKIKALAAQGKSFREIRAIMNGEPVTRVKGKGKKTSGKR